MIKSYLINFNSTPSLISLLELIKPVTWFPPMWAFLCGVVSVGALNSDNILLILSGLILAGPLVCGMSQAVNDVVEESGIDHFTFCMKVAEHQIKHKRIFLLEHPLSASFWSIEMAQWMST